MQQHSQLDALIKSNLEKDYETKKKKCREANDIPEVPLSLLPEDMEPRSSSRGL